MLQVIYTSVATAPLPAAELRSLLTSSRLRNTSVEVTGHLLFDGLRFLQALEGPEAAVQATLDRIAADKRHRDVTVIRREPVAQRLFGEWSMGFGDGSEANLARRGYKPLTADAFIPADLSGQQAADLLRASLQDAGAADYTP